MQNTVGRELISGSAGAHVGVQVAGVVWLLRRATDRVQVVRDRRPRRPGGAAVATAAHVEVMLEARVASFAACSPRSTSTKPPLVLVSNARGGAVARKRHDSAPNTQSLDLADTTPGVKAAIGRDHDGRCAEELGAATRSREATARVRAVSMVSRWSAITR